jgi:hypothetical protein
LDSSLPPNSDGTAGPGDTGTGVPGGVLPGGGAGGTVPPGRPTSNPNLNTEFPSAGDLGSPGSVGSAAPDLSGGSGGVPTLPKASVPDGGGLGTGGGAGGLPATAGSGLGSPGGSGSGFAPGSGATSMPSGSGLVPDSAKLSGGDAPTGGAGLGSAGAPGSAGASGAGSGMPPMMPPGSGQGLGKKERERTTWLNEDEKVWGLDDGVGAGVIGRPDEDEEDEFAEGAAVLPRRPGRDTSATQPGGPRPKSGGQEEAVGEAAAGR